MIEVKGELFGVRIEHPGFDGKHAIVELITEDNGMWFPVGNSFSSHWINDLINVLKKAKKNLKDEKSKKKRK